MKCWNDTIGLLHITKISSLFAICVSFLVPTINLHGFFMDSDEVSRTTVGFKDCFFAVAAVCKTFKTALFALQRKFLCPRITTEICLKQWYSLIPSLSHVCLANTILSIPFHNLQLLNFEKKKWHMPSQALTLNIVTNWNIRLLKYLSISSMHIDVETLNLIAEKCPFLKQLRVAITSENTNVHLTNFLHLKRLAFAIKNTSLICKLNTKVYISNMPCLRDVEILDVNIQLLEFGTNLKLLQSIVALMSCCYLEELIFKEHMPFLNRLDLRKCQTPTKFDPFMCVDWEHVKRLTFAYDPCCDTACGRLRDIQIFGMMNRKEYINPCIPWHNMSYLQDLELTWATSEMIHTFASTGSFRLSLTSLYLRWDDDITLDLAEIAQFVNLSSLCLAGGEHVNFQHLAALKHLNNKKITCSLQLTLEERTLWHSWLANPKLCEY